MRERKASALLLSVFMSALVAAPIPQLVSTASAESTAGQDPPLRDEFGTIPEDAVDKDLRLPDPLLDRTWPGRLPGEPEPLPRLVPEEDAIDPFADDGRNERDERDEVEEQGDWDRREEFGSPGYDDAPADEAFGVPPSPSRPLVGPDGQPDSGSPMDAADPFAIDSYDGGGSESPTIFDESPSPLDGGDSSYGDAMGDPGGW